MLLYQILAYTIHTETINLKYKLKGGMINLSYLTNFIPYQIFKIILSISSKNKKKRQPHPQMQRILVKKFNGKFTGKFLKIVLHLLIA